MPNLRRRRFSVKDDIIAKGPGNLQNVPPISSPQPDPKVKRDGTLSSNTAKSAKPKLFVPIVSPDISYISCLDTVPETNSNTSVTTVKRAFTVMDKKVSASSSNINLVSNSFSGDSSNSITPKGTPKKREVRNITRESMSRREKHPRQHRIKVRSPKPPVVEQESCGTNTIDWDQEIEVLDRVTNAVEGGEEERPSSHSHHSLEDMCRICHGGEAPAAELGALVSACACRGTVGRVHVKCLERWLTESGKSRCELCGTRYVTQRVHRYGVPRALLMWLLSHNAKQLMVDSLGIMLMSPLAILAAWLSGRTLAGLMTQDNQVTPWPLASTFVLACMTLVCYYCWIVSAATRHALGWWVWYRSQYEVRLQLQNTTED